MFHCSNHVKEATGDGLMILYRGQKRNAGAWKCNTISWCAYFPQVSVELETGATSLARWQWGSMFLKQSLKDKGPDVCEGSTEGGIAFPQPPKHAFVLWVWMVQKVDSSVQRSTADVSSLWVACCHLTHLPPHLNPPSKPHTISIPGKDNNVYTKTHPHSAVLFIPNPKHTYA